MISGKEKDYHNRLVLLHYGYYSNAGTMVTIGGTATSIMLLIVVYVAFNYKYKLSVSMLKTGTVYNIIFIISSLSIALFGLYSLYEVLR